MLKYICEPEKIGPINVIVEDEGEVSTLEHYVLHSPDGFQMVYGGSGPAELARCILIDYFKRKQGLNEKVAINKSDKMHQQFKWDFITPAKKKLIITNLMIREWLLKNAKK